MCHEIIKTILTQSSKVTQKFKNRYLGLTWHLGNLSEHQRMGVRSLPAFDASYELSASRVGNLIRYTVTPKAITTRSPCTHILSPNRYTDRVMLTQIRLIALILVGNLNPLPFR